ncbi:MAG: hypothetical protein IJT98_01055 [Prevotella sp.]|nr:hypothetical protein [Prevotella sp.]
MKKQFAKGLLLICALLMTATVINAQGREPLRRAIQRWGNCKNVAITRTNGDVALNGRNNYVVSAVPQELSSKLRELKRGGHLIDDVTLTENGNWVILWDTNDATWSSGLPQRLIDKINEYHRNGYVVRSITFNDNGEWVIVSDEYYSASSSALERWLQGGTENYGKLWTVAVTDNGAVAVYDRGFRYRGNVPEELKQALRETSYDVYRLKYAGSSWFFADNEGNFRYNM